MTLFSAKKIDGTSLFLFRIGLGVMLTGGYISLLTKTLLFHVFSIEPIRVSILDPLPLSFESTLILLTAGLILSVALAIGYSIKYTAPLLTLTSAYLLLTHFTNYNNHYYLIILVLAIISVSHADNGFSVKKHTSPLIPQWNLSLLRIQCLLPYFFSGLQKAMDVDWRNGILIHEILLPLETHSVLGPLVKSVHIGLLAKGVILFDLSIGFLIWNKKTRPWACVIFIVFHLLNHFVLFSPLTFSKGGVGIFPLLSILTLILFLEPSHIQKIRDRLIQIPFKAPTEAPLTPPQTSLKLYGSIAILTVIALYPLIGYLASSKTSHHHQVIGKWTTHALHQTGKMDVFYQHSFTGHWILFTLPPHSLLPIHANAIYTPTGQYHILNHVKKEMEKKGLYVHQIGVSANITINSKPLPQLHKIIEWTTLTPQTLDTSSRIHR